MNSKMKNTLFTLTMILVAFATLDLRSDDLSIMKYAAFKPGWYELSSDPTSSLSQEQSFEKCRNIYDVHLEYPFEKGGYFRPLRIEVRESASSTSSDQSSSIFQ